MHVPVLPVSVVVMVEAGECGVVIIVQQVLISIWYIFSRTIVLDEAEPPNACPRKVIIAGLHRSTRVSAFLL